jgi:hypothetical protein
MVGSADGQSCQLESEPADKAVVLEPMVNRHKLPLIQQHRAISCGNVGVFTLGAGVQDQKI